MSSLMFLIYILSSIWCLCPHQNLHLPTNKKEEKTVAAVKYHDNLNIIICINQYLLKFDSFDIFCQTIPINF